MGRVRLSVGVDLGATNVRGAVVDTAGRIRSLARSRVGDDRSPAGVVARTAKVVRQALEQADLRLAEISHVGVGVAGQVRGDSGVVALAPNLGWREVPCGQMLADALGRRVWVINDLEAIAWGEANFGAARGHRHVLVVFCGTGIGGGLVLEGRPYHGASGVAGEIGHVKVRSTDGARCGCGADGCLEAYLGGGNLSRRLQSEALADWPELLALAGGDAQAIHPGLVEQLVQQGDSRAQSLWQELSEMLGDVLANAVTLLNLSALVLGGTVLHGCPSLQRLVREVVDQRVLAVAGESLAVVGDALGDCAGIIGAASLDLAEPRRSG